MDFVSNYLITCRSGFSDTDVKKYDKKFWRDVTNTFLPMVREVPKYGEDIVSVCDGRKEFQPFLWDLIFEAKSKGKTIFEIAGSYEISELLGNTPKDATWSSGTMVDFCSKNPSTATGRFIQDYVPRSLGSHKLPKKRSKKITPTIIEKIDRKIKVRFINLESSTAPSKYSAFPLYFPKKVSVIKRQLYSEVRKAAKVTNKK